MLACAEMPDPAADAEAAVVAVRAAAINPSDLANVAGRFPHTTLPRTPGRDYAGVVIDGPPAWRGAAVWGTGNSGFTRDGTHAERLAVPVASLRRKPEALSFAQAACVGVPFVTAWIGLMEAAALRAGESVAIIGITGAVGGAGAQIATRLGARVIGIARRAPLPGTPAAAMQVLTPPSEAAASAVRDATGGRGVDVVLDCVGGAMFEPALAMLAPGGRLVAMTSRGQRRVSFDLLDFYHNESRLLGIDSLARDLTAAAHILHALAPGFADGAYAPPPVECVLSLDAGVAAYRRAAEMPPGRVVLAPSATTPPD